jgi:prolycopene isomerase
MAKKYDAVVIGAGLGGLSAATFLAKNGKEVLLLERHNIPGGYATSFRRGRFEFDISLHELSGIGTEDERGSLYYYLESIGVAQKMKFLPMDHLYRVVDKDMDLTLPAGRDKAQEYLIENFPKEAQGIENFFETMQSFMNDFGGVLTAAAMRAEDLAPEKYPHFIKYGMKTYREVIDEFISDQALKNALSPYWGYGGLPPSKIPFQLMASIWEAFLRNPPAHIRGRCQALSNAFMESFFESGGEVRFNCGAQKIVLKDGVVSGVITDDGDEVNTTVVVSNANPLSTMIDLVGTEETPKKYLTDLNSRIIGFSTVNLYVGLDCPPEAIGVSAHENFINMSTDIDTAWEKAFTLEPPEGFLFTCYNATDPDFSPPGTSVIVLTAASYARPWYLVPPERYVDTKNAFADEMLTVADGYFPGLREHIEVIEVATPITNMRYTGNPGGAIYGFEQYLSDYGMLRLRHKAPIDGLFFASAWTIPGGGYQPSITAGSLAGGRALAKLS